MSIYLRTRTEDVRALAGAIALGSSAGLVIGAVYLAGVARPPAEPSATAPAQLQAAATPPALLIQRTAVAAVRPSAPVPGFSAMLRNPFGLEGFAAKRFRFQQVAEAPSELHCLTEAVYFEARGEGRPGQQAVAQVVLNRVRHPAFPKTICAVVHQRAASGCQFSFACGREEAGDLVAWRRAQTVADEALHGAVMAAVGDATHFQAARASPFAGLLRVAQVGEHIFYRFAGRPGAAISRQSPELSDPKARVQLAHLEPASPVTAAAMTNVPLATPSPAPVAVQVHSPTAVVLKSAAPAGLAEGRSTEGHPDLALSPPRGEPTLFPVRSPAPPIALSQS